MLAGDAYLITLRLFHVLFGVAWVGSVFFLVFFVQPSAAAIGPDGAPFMRELLGNRRLVTWILWIAAVTILAGALLYWEDWRQYPNLVDWVSTRFGLGLTIGMLSALTAFSIGFFGTRPNVGRLLAVGAKITQAEGPAPPELAQEVQRLQGLLKAYARWALAFLTISVITMATARYW
jgi:uncharacterized membrane protein